MTNLISGSKDKYYLKLADLIEEYVPMDHQEDLIKAIQACLSAERGETRSKHKKSLKTLVFQKRDTLQL